MTRALATAHAVLAACGVFALWSTFIAWRLDWYFPIRRRPT